MLDKFKWINEPNNYRKSSDKEISFSTLTKTDMWDKTHYGFSVHNAHMFVREISEKKVFFAVKTEFNSNFLFDQCGIVIYINDNNWAKFSSEFEDEQTQKLGGVVTRDGYSDWSTTDIPNSIREIFYEVYKTANDFVVKASFDGENYFQLRVFNLNNNNEINDLKIGIYGCSPQGPGFESTFTTFKYHTT